MGDIFLWDSLVLILLSNRNMLEHALEKKKKECAILVCLIYNLRMLDVGTMNIKLSNVLGAKIFTYPLFSIFCSAVPLMVIHILQ